MSLHALKWASQIRGLTIAEHGIVFRLAMYHDGEHGRCDPKRSTLAFQFECSRIYLTQIFQHLEHIGFVKRQSRPNYKHKQDGWDMAQQSNQYDLNFKRYFPIPGSYTGKGKDKKYVQDTARGTLLKKILGVCRRAVPSPELAQGIVEVWIEDLPKRAGKRARKPGLWICVESKGHMNHIVRMLPEIYSELRADLNQDLEYPRFLNTQTHPNDGF